MEAFAYEAAEEVFGNGVVIRVALAGHTLPNAKIGEALLVSTGGVLDAAIGVEDQAEVRLAATDSYLQRGKREARVNAVGEGVANDLFCAKVLHDGAVEPALVRRDVGDIANPSLVGGVKREIAREQIGSDRMRMFGVCSRSVSAFAKREDVQLVHETMDALARAGKVFADQVVQAVQAEGRILHTQRQKPAFQRLIVQLAHRGLAMRPFAVPAAGDFEQPA